MSRDPVCEVVNIPSYEDPSFQQALYSMFPIRVIGERAADRRSAHSIPNSRSGGTMYIDGFQRPLQRAKVIVARSENPAGPLGDILSNRCSLCVVHGDRYGARAVLTTKKAAHPLEVLQSLFSEIL